tara:strand:+ start:369 stop:815 length:447 start_codon:yes stop_codon:yes gene_type:complete
MATTITEIEQIDAIECLPSGAVQVKKGTYYEKKVTETVTDEEGNPVVDEDGNQSETTTITKDHVSNWRGVIDLRDEARAEELLGEKKSVALAHWESFPVEESEGEQLAKPDESNTVAEIKAYLDQEEIAYTSSQTKAELLALIPEEGE